MEEKILMNKFVQNRIASGLASTTIDSYCYCLRDFYQYLMRNNVERVNSDIIENYFIYLRGRYSQYTLRDKFAILHAYYQYCVSEGYYNESPIKLRKPKLPQERARCFTDEEVYKIFSYFSNLDSFVKIRNYTVICVLLSTGVRRNELLSIKSIYGNNFVINGKGSKQRFVPISKSLDKVLKKYIPERNKIACTDKLIITKDGKSLSIGGLRSIFTKISRDTGIAGKRFSSHTFRHFFATKSIQSGMDIATLQRILGHSDISTTSIYLNWNNTMVAEINEKTNPLNFFKII